MCACVCVCEVRRLPTPYRFRRTGRDLCWHWAAVASFGAIPAGALRRRTGRKLSCRASGWPSMPPPPPPTPSLAHTLKSQRDGRGGWWREGDKGAGTPGESARRCGWRARGWCTASPICRRRNRRPTLANPRDREPTGWCFPRDPCEPVFPPQPYGIEHRIHRTGPWELASTRWIHVNALDPPHALDPRKPKP